MSVKCVYAKSEQLEEILINLKQQLLGFETSLLLVFASSIYDPDALCSGLNQHFPGIPAIGCSSAGEITAGKMLEGSVAVMAISKDTVKDFKIEVLEHLSEGTTPDRALEHFSTYFGQATEELSHRQYVGLVLIDGLSMAEENLMEKLGDRTNLAFVGGSAGDDLQFKKTHVFANGQAYHDAAVLILLEPTRGYELLKTQSFTASSYFLTPTQVDTKTRTVHTFNGEPARQAYAKALGIEPELLDSHLMRHPLGLMDGKEPFVRSPQRLIGDAIVFYCQVREGIPLAVLNPGDIVEDTRLALQNLLKKGPVTGLVSFDCILRALQLQQEKQTQTYGELFKNIPTLGFNTYGEAYITHLNQTATLLVLK